MTDELSADGQTYTTVTSLISSSAKKKRGHKPFYIR